MTTIDDTPDTQRTIPNEPDTERPPITAYGAPPSTNGTNGHAKHEQRPPAHDPAAEAAALGAALLNNEAALAVAALGPAAFYVTPHADIAHTIAQLVAAGTPVDAITVNTHLTSRPGTHADLQQILLLATHAPTTHARTHLETVRRLHIARQIEHHAQEAATAARAGQTERATTHLANATTAAAHTTLTLDPDPDLDAFLAEVDEDYDWIVPGLLETRDRVIITAVEGGGKSTLLRQIAVQLASGLDPFTLEPLDRAHRVLYVDCENSPRQARRALRTLRTAAGDHYQDGHLRLRVLGEAMELADPATEADLAARIADHQADIVILGPLYKIVTGDPIKEEPAKAVANAIDRLRNIRGSAFLIEAHSPYAEGAKTSNRPIRPYGASLWSRWPEFGLHIDDTGTLKHWRGQREARSWPHKLQHDTPWPWAVAPTGPESTWDGPTECSDAIVAFLNDAGGTFSVNQLEKRLRELGKGFRTRTISDAARLAHENGRIDRTTGPRGALLYAPLTLQPDPFEEF